MSVSDIPAGATEQEKEALEILSKMEEKAVISEDIFVKRYLPMFASKDKNVDLTPWLDVAGNAYRYVDVRSGDEVLFTVPPLLKRSPTNVTRRPRDSMIEFMSLVEKKMAINPHLGRSFMDAELDHRVARLGIDLDETEQWNKIFERYGIEPIVELSEDQVSKASAGEGQDKGLFSDGYEEL